jgi:peptidyl-prolyl cis-trans isomerase C
MFLLTLLLACEPNEQSQSYVPGAIETTGATIATVNGVQIQEGIIDALLKDVPADKQAEIKASPNFSKMKDQLITTEVLYQEAIKANIHQDADAQLVMHLTEREVLTDFLIKKLAKEKMTDEYLKTWYDEHLVQFKKETAEVFMIVAANQADADVIVAELDAGGDFAAIAKEKSIDPQSKANGGSLGEIELSAVPPQMAMALNSAEEGKHTKPINMGGAFGILKSMNKKTDVTPFEEVKDQIKENALTEISQEIVTELREKANVVMPDEAPKADVKADEKVEVKTEVKADEKVEVKTEKEHDHKHEDKK